MTPADLLDLRRRVHPSGLPLEEVDFDSQLTLDGGGWGNECAGVCGV